MQILITKSVLKATPPLYSTQHMKPEEVRIRCKFFTPWSGWTWYMTEYDPENRLAFGWAINSAMPECAELGYFSLDEMEAVTGPFGLKIERDIHYSEGKFLADVMPEPVTVEEAAFNGAAG